MAVAAPATSGCSRILCLIGQSWRRSFKGRAFGCAIFIEVGRLLALCIAVWHSRTMAWKIMLSKSGSSKVKTEIKTEQDWHAPIKQISIFHMSRSVDHIAIPSSAIPKSILASPC